MGSSSDVRLGLEGQSIVQAGELGTLVGLLQAEVGGMDRDAFPDFLGECLLGVGSGGQFGSDPFLRDSDIVLGLLI